jgi:hypothetical protein
MMEARDAAVVAMRGRFGGGWRRRIAVSIRPGRAAIAALATLATVALAVVGCGGQDATTARRVERIPAPPVATGDAPVGLLAGEDVLYVVHDYGRAVVRVTGDATVETFADGPDGPRHPVLAFGSLWVVQPGLGGTVATPDGAEYALDAVVRLDPASGAVQATIGDLGTQLLLAATEHDVWVAGERAAEHGWLWRIDAASDRVTVVQHGGDLRTAALVPTADGLWFVGNCDGVPCDDGAGRVRFVDAGPGTVTPLGTDLPDDLLVSEATLDGDRLWLVGFAPSEAPEGRVLALDPRGKVVVQQELGRMPSGLLRNAEGLWLADCLAGTLTLLEPTDGTPVGDPIEVGVAYPEDEPLDWYREDYACPGALAELGDTLWVANWNDDALVPVR